MGPREFGLTIADEGLFPMRAGMSNCVLAEFSDLSLAREAPASLGTKKMAEKRLRLGQIWAYI
jgi:hypothetical protein